MKGLSQWIRIIVLSCLCVSFAAAQERVGGITGTGILPARISGTVTELGSIHVNGQHIRFDTGMPVQDAVFLASAEDIRPGHTVAVVAEPAEGDWQALSIRQIMPLLGPMDEVGDGWLTVMGTHVVASGLTGDIAPGQWVAVSGLWRDREVVASRLDPVPSGAVPARILGTAFPD
ncbi:MAG: hypothetical protein KDE08_11620 [Rhodobacteraceae bacterium]|nr:hypothetical protein [Paracoccaceae bacterium]